ncbi:MAG: carboxypeptidase-like regulatory domain-containing protein, partial [Leadbetterella sp.]
MSISSFAQLEVSGVVTDMSSGQSVPGVTVMIAGSSKGVNSDVNGKYSITVPNKKATLIFSFVGYLTQEIAVNGRREMNVSLVIDTKTLEEVVVVGYGEIRKSDLTGAVSQLKYSEDSDKPITSADQFIQGRVSGVS